MTGQYPLTNGVFINDVPLAPKGATLGEAFQRAGYHTGYIGKWHLYGSPDGHYGRRLSYIPPDKRFGFEYWKACRSVHTITTIPCITTTTTIISEDQRTIEMCELVLGEEAERDPNLLDAFSGLPVEMERSEQVALQPGRMRDPVVWPRAAEQWLLRSGGG